MRNIIFYLFAIVLSTYSCSKEYLDVQPSNQVSAQTLFETVNGAQSVIDGVLRDMRSQHNNNHDQFGVKAIDLAIDLMGEDMAVEKFHWFGADYRFENHDAKGYRSDYVWTLYYRMIYNLNEVINHNDFLKAQPEAERQHIKAQAFVLRAYSYFQLIQLFQNTYNGSENAPGVPVYTEATTSGNPRSTVQEVYNRIVDDLDQAIALFEGSNQPRLHISHPTVHVAKGLMARVTLVMQNWETAAEMAAGARTGYSVMTADEYALGFDNYTEQNWIWGLEINQEQSTTYGSWFSHVDWSIGGYCGAGLSRKMFSRALYNRMNDNDIRKLLVDTTFMKGGLRPDKFSAGNDKGWNADYVMMRPEEMLLIEAEALVKLGKEQEAKALLTELHKNRMNNHEVIMATGTQLLEEIRFERRIELWGEGFALLDIKRLKKGLDRTDSNHDPVVAQLMSLEPESTRFNFKIPQKEIDSNPFISDFDQNP